MGRQRCVAPQSTRAGACPRCRAWGVTMAPATAGQQARISVLARSPRPVELMVARVCGRFDRAGVRLRLVACRGFKLALDRPAQQVAHPPPVRRKRLQVGPAGGRILQGPIISRAPVHQRADSRQNIMNPSSHQRLPSRKHRTIRLLAVQHGICELRHPKRGLQQYTPAQPLVEPPCPDARTRRIHRPSV